MESYLTAFFNNDEALFKGAPTVGQVSDHLKVSPRYLSDMLRSLTGQTKIEASSYVLFLTLPELCSNKTQEGMELKNSAVLITGGTNDIGLELIKQLIREGTNITVTGPSHANAISYQGLL